MPQDISLLPGERHHFNAVSESGAELGAAVLRIHSGKPSYDPATLTTEGDAEFQASPWGDTTRSFRWRSPTRGQAEASLTAGSPQDTEINAGWSLSTDTGRRISIEDLPQYQQEDVRDLLNNPWPGHQETGREHLKYYLYKLRNRINKAAKMERIAAEAATHVCGDWMATVRECVWDSDLVDVWLVYDNPDDDEPAAVTENIVGLDPTSKITEAAISEMIGKAECCDDCAGTAVRKLLAWHQRRVVENALDGTDVDKEAVMTLASRANAAEETRRHDEARDMTAELGEMLRGTQFSPLPIPEDTDESTDTNTQSESEEPNS